MQDIGGVRAVLDSIDEVRRVEKRLCKNRPPVAASEYITDPRKSGYRGVHVVVTYADRRIEVQLRTWVIERRAEEKSVADPVDAQQEVLDTLKNHFDRSGDHVNVGEHLGYLFTGIWSVLIGVGVIQTTALLPGWAGPVSSSPLD